METITLSRRSVKVVIEIEIPENSQECGHPETPPAEPSQSTRRPWPAFLQDARIWEDGNWQC